MYDKITQSPGGKKWEYMVESHHYMHTDVVFFEKCNIDVCCKSLSHH